MADAQLQATKSSVDWSPVNPEPAVIALARTLAAGSGTTDLGQAIEQAVPGRLEFSDWITAGAVVVATVIPAVFAHYLVMRPNGRDEIDSYAVRILARAVSTAIVIGGSASSAS